MASSPSNVNHLEPAQSGLSEISSKRTKELIKWLRDYAQRRINSRLAELRFGLVQLLGQV